MMSFLLRSAAFASLTLVFGLSQAVAQDAQDAQGPQGPQDAPAPSEAEMAEARGLFNQGIEAARAERWEEARTHFERSYQTVERSSTLLNLAAAQAETGQLVQSSASYRRFIDTAGPREARLLPSAEEALEEVEARLAHVSFDIDNLEADDEVWLDDDVVPNESLDTEMPTNPGDHVLAVARGGAVAGETAFSLEEGESRQVALSLEPTTSVLDGALTGGDATNGSDDDGGVWSSPWLWVGVGVVVLAAILIPVAIVSSGGETPPHMGTLGAGTLTFE